MTPEQADAMKAEVDYQRGLLVNLQGLANGAEIEPVLRIAEASLFTALERAFEDMAALIDGVGLEVDR